MSTIEQTLLRLQKSAFRAKFHLSEKDRQYIMGKGMETIQHHAADFIRMRLAPASVPNDGKQTPMRGHPVFIAQHACACCCRSCLNKSLPSVDNLYALGALFEVPMEDILVSRTSQLNLIICEQQAEACCSPLFMGELLRLSRIRQRAKIA